MQGATLKSLSLALGRNETYLHQFVWYSSPQKLDEYDRVKLAALLKVDQQTLRAPGHLGNTPDLPPDFLILFPMGEEGITLHQVVDVPVRYGMRSVPGGVLFWAEAGPPAQEPGIIETLSTCTGLSSRN